MSISTIISLPELILVSVLFSGVCFSVCSVCILSRKMNLERTRQEYLRAHFEKRITELEIKFEDRP